MTVFGRLRVLVGVVLVSVLCAVLLLFLEHSMSRVHSKEAYLDSDSYTVGLDYSAVVEKQYKDENDNVKSGDTLFEVRSARLSDAIRNNEIAARELLYSVNEKGLVVITAAADGSVREIAQRQGAFVPANTEMATIDLTDGTFVRATYKLSAPDYARLNSNSRVVVTLPDGVEVEGSVYDIAFETVDQEVRTTVKARIDTTKVNQRVFTSGTPVETVLHVDDNSLYSRLERFMQSYFGGQE